MLCVDFMLLCYLLFVTCFVFIYCMQLFLLFAKQINKLIEFNYIITTTTATTTY